MLRPNSFSSRSVVPPLVFFHTNGNLIIYIQQQQHTHRHSSLIPKFNELGQITKMFKHVGNRILGLGQRSPVTRGVLTRLYHERVVDHYNNPRNVGSFDKNDPTVGTGLVGAPACGDVMKLQIKVDEQTGKITDACFKTFGCGSAIASSSVATEWVKGRQMEEVLSIKNTEIAKHLSLPPVKLHCSMLAEDAIKAAVKDYEAKKAKFNGKAENASSEKAV